MKGLPLLLQKKQVIMIKLLMNKNIFSFPSKSMQNRKDINFDELILLSLNYSILTARIHVPKNSTTHTHSHTHKHIHTNKHNIRLTHTLFIISKLLYFNCSKVIKNYIRCFSWKPSARLQSRTLCLKNIQAFAGCTTNFE